MTHQFTAQDIAALVAQAAFAAAQATQQQHQQPAAGALPPHLRNQAKARLYADRKSGNISQWLREMRTYCRLVGSNMDDPANAASCRCILEANLTGEAAQFVLTRMDRLTGNDDQFLTLPGFIEELKQRFTCPEEETEARRKLDNLRMTRGMSARAYCETFQRLLDAAATVADPEAFYRFKQGLPENLRNWLKYSQSTGQCKTLHEAMALVIRMDDADDQERLQPATKAEPMAMELDQLRAQLSRIGMDAHGQSGAPRASTSRPGRDPRRDPRWPQWAKRSDDTIQRCLKERSCFLCFKSGHAWPSCPKLDGAAFPSRAEPHGGHTRSPSPDWRTRAPAGGPAWRHNQPRDAPLSRDRSPTSPRGSKNG